MIKCPKCEFEQIEESPSECARCGILFEKWLDRQEREQEQEQERQESYSAPASAVTPPVEQSGPPPQIYFDPPAGAIWGTRLCGIGVLMITLPLLSFLINLVGFEFILLMPLEAFDNPTHAKFWMMGSGVVAIVLGALMGGEIPDED